MTWTWGGPLTATHRARLLERGADPEALTAPVREVLGPLPEGWHEAGNALYQLPDEPLPLELVETMTALPLEDVLVVIGSRMHLFRSLLIGGNAATVFIGPQTQLSAGEIYCGGSSAVILNGQLTATRCAIIDARNGGSIVTQPDQLWAANVYVATDDMHRLTDVATGVRRNPYGATIRLGRHLWLGRDAIVTGHVDIGEDCVVGARSMVRNQKVADGVAVAGTPAREIATGITWDSDDQP